MENQLRKVPSLYLFIYQALKSMSSNKFFISYAEAKEVLNRRLYKIPKKLHIVVLKEMEEYKLIKKFGENVKCLRYKFLAQEVEKFINNHSTFF
jgi:hypothetical protein